MQRQQTSDSGDFEAVLIEEIEILKNSERRLQRLYPHLRTQPQLRDYFLMELSAVRQRADRLNAVLNPLATRTAAAVVESPVLRPAA
ncbi:MAG TPA: hypothetical protein VKX49_23900 [Bryobacteraceae bacterium]|nr:hypothetical protein [Bryobacteraceae bacterium]